MGTTDSKQNEEQHTMMFSESEKHEFKKLFHHIVGTQNFLTEPFVLTVHAIIKSYCFLSAEDKPNKSWHLKCSENDIVKLALSLLGFNEIDITVNAEREKRFEEVEIWLSKCPMFLKMYDRVFLEVFPVIPKDVCRPILRSLMPLVSNVDWSKMLTVLDPLSVSFINYNLNGRYQSIWQLLYSNNVHGESFAQLVHLITEKGPTVIIVQDKDGHMFGGFASDNWNIKPVFYGSSECFLFTLKPNYAIYPATGYNDHFMYLNQGQETLPNGLGMGGQLDYYGMWIDKTFNKGHSKAVPKCTTFGSPQLSASPEFDVVHIEVWGVGPEKTRRDSEEVEDIISILDRDTTAKSLLELAGKPQHSDGLRDLPEDEEMTEEMKYKMNIIPKML